MQGSRWRKGASTLAAPLAIFLVLVVASVATGAGQGPAGEGLYIVALEDSVENPGAVGREQIERLGGRLGFVYRYGPIGYSAALPDDAVKALRRSPVVKAVWPDRVNADVQAVQSPSTGIKRVFAYGNKALKIDEVNNVTINADVAVIDGGFSKEESDLSVSGQVYCNWDGKVAACKEGEGDDEEDGHGTAVASVAGAIDNTEGVVGVAPSVRLWSVKVFDPNVLESEIVAGLNWVTEKAATIEVVNMSLECGSLPCTREAAVAAMTKAVEAGVVVVVAAGNLNKDAEGSAYASHADAIAVSGIADYDGLPEYKATALWSPSCGATEKEGDEKVGEDDFRYTYSNYGKVIDVAAPAVCIQVVKPGKTLALEEGTSFAAPAVSGAAAILAAQSNPNSKADVEKISKTIREAGNKDWKDDSPDKEVEPLLDLKNETTFK